jgi:hypothetical protein
MKVFLLARGSLDAVGCRNMQGVGSHLERARQADNVTTFLVEDPCVLPQVAHLVLE